MSLKRIVASYAEDSEYRIVIVAEMTADGRMSPDTPASGYARDWDEESESFQNYSFVLEPVDEKHAKLRWEDDLSETFLDVMGRRLVTGETILYRDSEGTWHYTIESVVVDAGASGELRSDFV